MRPPNSAITDRWTCKSEQRTYLQGLFLFCLQKSELRLQQGLSRLAQGSFRWSPGAARGHDHRPSCSLAMRLPLKMSMMHKWTRCIATTMQN